MKKFLILFIAIFTLCSTNVNGQSSSLTEITSDYQTLVDLKAAIFDFGQNRKAFITNGVCYVKFNSFGSAGNRITIKFSIDKFDDGNEITKHFEDVIFARDNEGNLMISNKFHEIILVLIKDEDKYAFCIENKMMLISD